MFTNQLQDAFIFLYNEDEISQAIRLSSIDFVNKSGNKYDVYLRSGKILEVTEDTGITLIQKIRQVYNATN